MRKTLPNNDDDDIFQNMNLTKWGNTTDAVVMMVECKPGLNLGRLVCFYSYFCCHATVGLSFI